MHNHAGVCGEGKQVHGRDGVYRDADGFDKRVLADDVVGEVFACSDDFAADAFGEFSGEDAGVQRSVAFAISFEELPEDAF